MDKTTTPSIELTFVTSTTVYLIELLISKKSYFIIISVSSEANNYLVVPVRLVGLCSDPLLLEKLLKECVSNS